MGQVYQATDAKLNRDASKKQRPRVESASTFDVRLPRRGQDETTGHVSPTLGLVCRHRFVMEVTQ